MRPAEIQLELRFSRNLFDHGCEREQWRDRFSSITYLLLGDRDRIELRTGLFFNQAMQAFIYQAISGGWLLGRMPLLYACDFFKGSRKTNHVQWL